MKSFLDNYKSIHFIGIGGISMSALAKYCLCIGKKVSGSDNKFSDVCKEVSNLGATVCVPCFDLKNLDCDLVVYSSAIGNNNKELMFAKERKIKAMKRSQFLQKILDDFINTICVCGCHGKTTSTAMLVHIFMQSNNIPTAFIGGIDKVFNNFFFGEKQLAIYEGCEYQKNILDFNPETIIITNIDYDHPDSYNSLEDTKNTFNKFACNKRTIVNADDINSSNLLKNSFLSFGIKKGRVRAENIRTLSMGSSFDVLLDEKLLGRVEINLVGEFNIYNALASICGALSYGVEFETIISALKEFDGVKRRQEYIGKFYGVDVFCDYAHHPSEIKKVIDIEKDKKCLVVFQPHTYSRTKSLKNEFVESFKNAKNIIIYKTYPSREEYIKEGDGKTLCKLIKKDGKRAMYCDNDCVLKRKIKRKIKRIERIIFLGAGDIYKIANSLVKNI